MGQALIIQAADLKRIQRDCAQRTPEEACGLLIGQAMQVHHIIPCPNVSPLDRTRHFDIDPLDQFQARRSHAPLGVIGFYHSHPNGFCTPSQTDKQRVSDPSLFWLILTAHDFAAFRFVPEKQDFAPLAIQVIVV